MICIYFIYMILAFLQSEHFPFIHCVEELSYQGKHTEWESCYEKLGLDSSLVDNCYHSEHGKEVCFFSSLSLKYHALTEIAVVSTMPFSAILKYIWVLRIILNNFSSIIIGMNLEVLLTLLNESNLWNLRTRMFE
jgi:hypothetical protein